MANNHNGDMEHAKNIIDTFSSLITTYPFKFGIKFQLRHYDTFIHPDAKGSDAKLVKRLESTKLSDEQFLTLANYAKSRGFLTIATIFDENSIDLFNQCDFDILKIASCSADDLPLLKSLASINKPTILSTASLEINEILKSIKLLKKDNSNLAIMHCVALYPTPNAQSLLNRIDLLRRSLPGFEIGYSTHEDPSSLKSAPIMAGKNVNLFEKHINIKSEKYSINKYSAEIGDLEKWLNELMEYRSMCSISEIEKVNSEQKNSLIHLKRGVFYNPEANRNIFFAIPKKEGQLDVSDVDHDFVCKDKLVLNSALIKDSHGIGQDLTLNSVAEKLLFRVNELLNAKNVRLPGEFELELSHHYGIENFDKTGVIILNILNKSYCKKYLVFLGGQNHPEHYHEREESLKLISGRVDISIEGKLDEMVVDNYYHVPSNKKHHFVSHEDSILEEISTFDHGKGSIYTDQSITERGIESRKTKFKIKNLSNVFHLS